MLRILKVVRAIRNRGHLSARLDPLGRSLGPLIEGYETMETSVPDGGADIARLLNGYPDGLFLRGRRVNAGQYLGLHDARPEREFYFGDELATLDAVQTDRRWWSLDDVLRRLRAAYCGTLSAEFDHLDSAAKKRWMRGRLEGHARDFFGEETGKVSSGTEISRDVRPGSSTVANEALRSAELELRAEKTKTDSDETDSNATPRGVWQSGGPVAGASKLEEGLWLDADEKRAILRRLLRAERLELFLGKHFPSAKRFGLEGAESLIPGLQALVETSAERGVEQIVVGMAHRGRLNILNSVFAKPLAAICAEMRSEGVSDFNVGDVRYHLGARAEVRVPFSDASESPDATTSFSRREESEETKNKKKIARVVEMTMAPNPSHLEAVNAVAAGMVRSKQARLDPGAGRYAPRSGLAFRPNTVHGSYRATTSSSSRKRVAGLLLHGDAAFCGLGANAEVMQLQDLPEYATGGTTHIVVNNQIGFTTVPRRARSSPHPSDVAKGYGAPIFHVNGDDPEAVVRAFRLAAEYRSTWFSDVVVNLVCYRRLGHNELDDPSITLPLRAAAIEAQPKVASVYAEKLIRENVCTRREIDLWTEEMDAGFERELSRSSEYVENPEDWAVSAWRRPTAQRECDVESGPETTVSQFPGNGADAFIVEDGPAGPQSRPRHRPKLTTTPNHGVIAAAASAAPAGQNENPKSWARLSRSSNPRAVTTGVPLPLLRALGMAVTELPEEREDEAKRSSDDDDDDDDDADTADDTDAAPRRRAALEARLIAVPKKTLFPPDFVPHPHVRRLLAARRAMVAAPEPGVGDAAAAGAHPKTFETKTPGVDWGAAELLAFGTLVLQTDDEKPHCHVRLSGQDVERGTFNHRHAVLYCSRTSRGVNPLDNLGLGRQDRFVAANSPLSEHAVLGFEYGYSVDAGHETLVLWEAQFGDFANNAQCVVDQFITTAEAKWGQRSGIVLLLPHGHDGQGPDHSSARPERWLAAANDDPDSTPGRSPRDSELAARTFHALLGVRDDEGLDEDVNPERKTGMSLSLERLKTRVEALEAEASAAAEDGGGDENASGEKLFDDLKSVFDEEGGLLSHEMLDDTETSSSGGSEVVPPRNDRRALRRKARAAREMLDDVFSFFGRDSGFVDSDAWARYMRHRAISHADASANFVVVSPSTPAQYFHALRRQALAPHRKPMVVLAPKYLLHHRPCSSPLGDFGPGSRFRAVIADGDRGDNLWHDGSGNGSVEDLTQHERLRREGAKRVIVCTGKLFYALHRARKQRGRETEVALIRLEQLFPFPHEALARRLARYPENAELVWAQEEPKNMGFWAFVQPRVETAVRELVEGRSTAEAGGGAREDEKTNRVHRRSIRYVGRPASASPASGSQTIHARENKALVDEALGGL